MVLGHYYLSVEDNTKPGTGIIFSSIDEVKVALANKAVHIHSVIGIHTDVFKDKKLPGEGILITTPGKILLNEVLPSDFPYINCANADTKKTDIVAPGNDVRAAIANRVLSEPHSKKVLSMIVDYLYKNYPIEIVPETMDKIKHLGFKYSTISSTTISSSGRLFSRCCILQSAALRRM